MLFVVFFAMIGGWNLFQINAMTAQYTEVTGGEASIFANNGWILGTIVAVITWFTIIGGIKAIGKFTSKVTPVMCTLYVASAFWFAWLIYIIFQKQLV